MGWQDRRYDSAGDGGRFRAVLRRIFGNGENPMDWALPLYTAWGIRVRVHLFYIVFMVAQLLVAASPSGIGPGHKAMSMAGLFVLVLLHEYGHCIACRRVGGTANQILMWPLGGLASCSPPHQWKPNLITVLAGPGVNLVLWPILALILIALGQGRSSLIFNPFFPGRAVPLVAHGVSLKVVWWVWWLYYTNAVLFLFNMLLPMYPMDCARTLQAILWSRLGYRRATAIVVNLGLGVAIVLGVFAATAEQSLLLTVAIFGGFECFMERRRLAMLADDNHPALAGYDFDRGYQGLPAEDDDDESREKARRKRERKEREDQDELDRILAKIAATGMASLSKAEKRWLEKASEERRR